MKDVNLWIGIGKKNKFLALMCDGMLLKCDFSIVVYIWFCNDVDLHVYFMRLFFFFELSWS